jgi:transcription elongation GreA/GreB family factor
LDDIKLKFYNKFLVFRLAELKESASNETKSTAGDKHETALAMVQIEQTNIRNQLAEASKQLTTIQKINLSHSDKISVGSWIEASNGNFLICVALGKVIIDDQSCYAISIDSPLGNKLLGLKSGATFQLNNIEIKIKNVY